ncbi:kinase [Rossellomorea vietnamensis]|uniref:kinase n=1 Tax=Rossellomorea vietnamensis TaxID=218284 RepID=UPI003D2B618D
MIDACHVMMETFLTKYHKRCSKHRPFIIGIDGLGGSGKTTLAEALKKEINYNTSILHLDDYIVEKSRRYGTGNKEWHEYYALQWDVTSLTTNLFLKLHHNLEIILPFYDSSTDTIVQKDFHYDQETIILIEGVFLQRKEWRDFFDFMIFIDCSKEVRSERVLGRDVYLGDYQARLDKYKRRYWLAEEHYIRHENPAGQADYIKRIR